MTSCEVSRRRSIVLGSVGPRRRTARVRPPEYRRGQGVRSVEPALIGEALTRPPKGFPPDHPAMDLIRCKQWGLSATLPAGAALRKDFAKILIKHFRLLAPMVDAPSPHTMLAEKSEMETGKLALVKTATTVFTKGTPSVATTGSPWAASTGGVMLPNVK